MTQLNRHITETDFDRVAAAVLDWQMAVEEQEAAVRTLAGALRCNEETALDLLNRYQTVHEILDTQNIEVHDARACARPWIDGETLLVLGLIVGGGALAAWAAMH